MGREIAMWMEVGDPGGVNKIGRKLYDVVGCMETNLSNDFLQIVMVPPYDLLLNRGRSASCLYSEFISAQ